MSVEAIGALHEPMRRAVYEYAARSAEPVGRNEVAEALGIGRTLAAFHLDRLAAAGLLEVSYARLSGRTGPGAGRPAKLYRRSAAEHSVSLPPRRYLDAAGLLAEAVETAGADEHLFAAARQRGRATAREADAVRSGGGGSGPGAGGSGLVEVLAGQGYEPAPADGRIVLGNCPFHAVARDYPPLVCGMNLALIEGLVEELPATGALPRLEPGAGRCCVVIELSKNKSR
jgi:predicted ArsR family transcriptional regulator